MKRIILLALLPILLFSCSDEKQIKRKLHAGGGKWEIMQYERYYWSPVTGNNQPVFTCAQCGTIEFKRNGSGSLSISDPEASGGFTFTYSNTADLLTLFTNDGGAVYEMTWDVKRKQLVMTQNLGSAGYVTVITCKKK